MSRHLSWVPRRVEPIGIDFGARCVRVLQVARHRNQVTITAMGQRAIPPGLPQQECRRLQVEAAREILRDGGFSGSRATCALGWDEIRSTTLRIPAVAEKEMDTAILPEASEHLGLRADEAEFRFMPAGDVRHGIEIRQEVIVLAATHEAVEARIAMLRSLGLEPAAIDAGACAVFRGFERFLRRDEDRNDVNVFVDVGYTATRVILSRGPDIILLRSIPVGGRIFDEYVRDSLDLSAAEAADLRITLHAQHVSTLTGQTIPSDQIVGETTQRAVLDALRSPLEQLSREIGVCLRYCSETFRGIRSSEVTVVGGEACNKDMLRLLSDNLNLPFHIGRPMRNIACDGDFDGPERRTGQPEWATAVGLALKPPQHAAEVAA